MILRDTQATFAGGEFTPALHGRTDIAKYKSGLRTARNVTVIPQGGCRNRPGTKYVADAGDSTGRVRLIPFIASSSVAYILELGDEYMRFYTLDARVESSPGTAYEISTPWAGDDVFKLKFAQSANTMYFAHPDYAPQVLTYTSSASWALAALSFINGPFRPQNTDTSWTLAASALSGSVTLTASKNLFDSGHVGALFEMVWTVVGQTITPSLTAAATNWIPTDQTWQAVISGTWSGTILVQTSPDNVTWTTVATVTSNGTSSGSTGFRNGYMRAIMQSALAFSGSASVALTGDGNTTGPTTLTAVNDATTPVPAGDTAVITLTSLTATGDTVKLQKSTDAGATWTDLASYTTDQAATSVATGSTACLIRAIKSVDGGGTPAATVNGTTGAAPTLSYTISTASVSQAIPCGSTWSAITTGTWTGKLRVEISTDGGNNWNLVQTFQSAGSNNFNTSGDTGVAQCLLRVSTEATVSFSGTATIDLTSQSFDWTGIVEISAVTNATSATATVQDLSNSDSTGLYSTSTTWQWSEGAWSDYRGWPAAVTFYQDRSAWASTEADPNTVWHSRTSSYADFGTSNPGVDTDGFDVLLVSRQLNSVIALIPMPQAMIALSSDMAFGLSPNSSGIYSAATVQQTPMDHRGSYDVEPVIVGNEVVLVQQMGTVVRNLIFQLAVNGFMGDNISVSSQHLFTGYTITQMAYQQEPDSIVWAVRSDGELLSCTYDRAQEMSAWTHHDTIDGLIESVAVIPSPANGLNELWLVVNRGGTRIIEVMKPRDQGTDPEDQWFVDCGAQYSGAATGTVTGLPSILNGKQVAVLADGFVVANGQTDTTPLIPAGGSLTLPNSFRASKITIGLPITWDVGLLPMETPSQKGTSQGLRVKQPRAKLRVWNSRGGYIATNDPLNDTGIAISSSRTFDEIQSLMLRDPDNVDMDEPLPLVTGLLDVTLPSGYQYDSHIFIRGIDPLPFTLLDVIGSVVQGGD